MPDLVAFLMARIGEDEAVAREVISYRGEFDDQPPKADRTLYAHDDGAIWKPSISMGAERLLAECESKRRIVVEHAEITIWHEGENASGDRTDEPEWFCGRCVDTTARQPWTDVDRVEFPCQTLRLLALPYASHPDYDTRWNPEVAQ